MSAVEDGKVTWRTLALGAVLLGLPSCAPRTGEPPQAAASLTPATAPALPESEPRGASLAGSAAEPSVQAVTVVNPTALTIEIDLEAISAGVTAVTRSFGPIPAGGRGTETIPVQPGGTLRVTARWAMNGERQTGRTYTVVYEQNPVTPVTLTFDSPFEGLGVWTSVVWDPPPSKP